VIASLSLPEVTFVLAALTLLVAAATFYFARLRPGRVSLRHLPTHVEWAKGGGVNGVPDLSRVTVRLAASNAGAHPCVLERLTVDRVDATGAPELATGAVMGQVTGARGTEVLSAVIDPGGSKQFEFTFELEGLVSTAMHTTPTPDLSSLASQLGRLKRLRIVINGEYQRTTRRASRTKSATVEIPLPAAQGRSCAAEFWRGQKRSDLAELVGGNKPAEE
jgi:hypothetical protein